MRYSLKPVLICLVAAGLSLAGCVAVDDDDVSPDGAAEEEAPLPIDPVTTLHEGRVTVGIGTSVLSVNDGEDYIFALPRKTSNVTGYILELTWDAPTPLSEDLELWIRATGAAVIPPSDPTNPIPEEPVRKASGPSPLRLAVPAEDIPDAREYDILVRATSNPDIGPAGVAVNQDFKLTLSVFKDTPYRADWTAI